MKTSLRVIVVIGFVVALVLTVSADDSSKRQLTDELDAARQAGLLRPTVDDVPDHENAWIHYAAAWDLLSHDPKIAEASRRFQDGQFGPDELPALERKLQPLISLIASGAQQSKCKVTSLEPGSERSIALFLPLSQFSKLLSVRTQQQVRAGDALGALETIGWNLRLARHAGSDENYVSQMARLALEAIALGLLPNALAAGSSNKEVMESATALMASHPERIDLRAALAAQYRILSEPGGLLEFEDHDSPESHSHNGNVASLLKAHRKAYERLKDARSLPDQHKVLQDLDQALLDSPLLMPTDANSLSLHAGFSEAVQKGARRMAIAKATTAIYHHRLLEGDFPESLPKSLPYLDPVTERPLFYERTASGFTLAIQKPTDATPREERRVLLVRGTLPGRSFSADPAQP